MAKNAAYYLRRIQRRNAFRSFPQDHVYAYLTRATGSIDMNVDGSGGDINFDYTVPAGTVYKSFKVARINFVMTDGAMRWGQFGGLGGALANGLLVQILDNGGVVQQHFDTDRQPIQANEDFGALAGVDNPLTAAAGDDALPVRFSIFKSGNHPTMFPDWVFRVVVQDNLGGLTKFRAMLQGTLIRDREPVIN